VDVGIFGGPFVAVVQAQLALVLREEQERLAGGPAFVVEKGGMHLAVQKGMVLHARY